jgi:hypothetical protein
MQHFLMFKFNELLRILNSADDPLRATDGSEVVCQKKAAFLFPTSRVRDVTGQYRLEVEVVWTLRGAEGR